MTSKLYKRHVIFIGILKVNSFFVTFPFNFLHACGDFVVCYSLTKQFDTRKIFLKAFFKLILKTNLQTKEAGESSHRKYGKRGKFKPRYKSRGKFTHKVWKLGKVHIQKKAWKQGKVHKHRIEAR